MRVFYIFIIIWFCILTNVFGQDTNKIILNQGHGLEGIQIETYALHPATGSSITQEKGLSPGSVTYRVFVDMAPGYKLQALYGIPAHPLQIMTTGVFYNNQNFGGKCGDEINDILLNDYNVAFDSWITIGAATRNHYGIPVKEDYDGSVLNYKAFNKSDGLIEGRTPSLRYFRFIPSFFQREDSSCLKINDGAWLVYEGVQGVTSSNNVLILQLTTAGSITLKLNLQLLSPKGEIEQFVYENAIDNEVIHKSLNISAYKANEYETPPISEIIPE